MGQILPKDQGREEMSVSAGMGFDIINFWPLVEQSAETSHLELDSSLLVDLSGSTEAKLDEESADLPDARRPR